MKASFGLLQKQLGGNLRALRLGADLSQMDLAGISDVDFTMISKIERGVTNPSLFTLHRLCVALEVELSLLIAGKSRAG